jgi:hypothetical protein
MLHSTVRMPLSAKAASKAAVKLESRSRMRNLTLAAAGDSKRRRLPSEGSYSACMTGVRDLWSGAGGVRVEGLVSELS